MSPWKVLCPGLPALFQGGATVLKTPLPSAVSSAGCRQQSVASLSPTSAPPPPQEEVVLAVTGAVGCQWGPALPELEETQRGRGDESSEGPVPLVPPFSLRLFTVEVTTYEFTFVQPGNVEVQTYCTVSLAEGGWGGGGLGKAGADVLISCFLTCPLVTVSHIVEQPL